MVKYDLSPIEADCAEDILAQWTATALVGQPRLSDLVHLRGLRVQRVGDEDISVSIAGGGPELLRFPVVALVEAARLAAGGPVS